MWIRNFVDASALTTPVTRNTMPTTKELITESECIMLAIAI
ncbi:MAG: hypothetical protein RMX96_13275 [Nostoc sp. ChiSLP02]|nr:hypothetical protein [Nostoc sp. DedSLP05]MDZ8099011.1 hypothetical protein [Nostoc sp. DedSLP01]MDZ8185813.1 hypothetical protein [Nostoc sp. ChiSLP02]